MKCAGTRLPADSSITSPGTSSRAGTTSTRSSRRTRAVSARRRRSCATAREARNSCEKPSSALPATMAPMVAASTQSRSSSDSPEASSRILPSGLETCRHSSRAAPHGWARPPRWGPARPAAARPRPPSGRPGRCPACRTAPRPRGSTRRRRPGPGARDLPCAGTVARGPRQALDRTQGRAGEIHRVAGSHSWRSASIGSSRAARRAGT